MNNHQAMPEILYVYRWRNNAKRAEMYGCLCRVKARGTMNSAMIEFIDSGELACVSRNALRRATVLTPREDSAK